MASPKKTFPHGSDLVKALEASKVPMTTASVHYAASEALGLPKPYSHGIAGTAIRLQRLFAAGLIGYKLNENGARVWYLSEVVDRR